MGNHLVKSTSLEKLTVLSLVSAKLEIESTTSLTISMDPCKPAMQNILVTAMHCFELLPDGKTQASHLRKFF